MSGVSLPAAKITFFVDGAKQFAKRGPLLFTHFGLSGPTILNSAATVGDLLHTGEVTAAIDVSPEIDPGTLDKKIVAVLDANKNKMIKNIVSEFVPPGLTQAPFLLIPILNPDIKAHSRNQGEAQTLGRNTQSPARHYYWPDGL